MFSCLLSIEYEAAAARRRNDPVHSWERSARGAFHRARDARRSDETV